PPPRDGLSCPYTTHLSKAGLRVGPAFSCPKQSRASLCLAQNTGHPQLPRPLSARERIEPEFFSGRSSGPVTDWPYSFRRCFSFGLLPLNPSAGDAERRLFSFTLI